MVAHVSTVAFHGIEAREVDVQVHMASGLPTFTVVGLPEKAVAESRERVRAALGALGLALPHKRLTVNLAPADLLKEGSHFDLPIAIGLLVEMGVLPGDEIAGYSALGELGLDGALLPVAGVLPAAIGAVAVDLISFVTAYLARRRELSPAERKPIRCGAFSLSGLRINTVHLARERERAAAPPGHAPEGLRVTLAA